MHIQPKLKHDLEAFQLWEVTIDSESYSVLINFETEVILISPGHKQPRTQFRLSNWIFDNIQENTSSIACISALAVHGGRTNSGDKTNV